MVDVIRYDSPPPHSFAVDSLMLSDHLHCNIPVCDQLINGGRGRNSQIIALCKEGQDGCFVDKKIDRGVKKVLLNNGWDAVKTPTATIKHF